MFHHSPVVLQRIIFDSRYKAVGLNVIQATFVVFIDNATSVDSMRSNFRIPEHDDTNTVVFIDCVHIKIHHKRSVDTEAFYVILAVKEDKTREVLGIYNKPTESTLGWVEMPNDLYKRGVSRIGLICAVGLKGLDDVVSEVFPGTSLQRCTTHLKRNILSDVRNGDKGDLADDRDRYSAQETGTTLWNGDFGARAPRKAMIISE